jgi:ferredoxin
MGTPKASATFFSGTGNTRHAAESLAAGLRRSGWRVTVHEIAPPRPGRPNDGQQTGAHPDLAVFAFPVFAFSVPDIVRRYLRSLPAADGIPAAVVAVFGNDFAGPPSARRRVSGFEGGALEAAARMLDRRGYRVVATRVVGYPTSFTQFMEPPREEECRLIRADAASEVAGIAADLAAGRHVLRERGIGTRIWTGVVGALFSLVGRRVLGKLYIADARCTSCGWCERACPAETIRMQGPGRRPRLPRWGWRCEACQRCINGCPEDAIQVSLVRLVTLVIAAMPWGLLVARSVPWCSFPGAGLLAWLVGALVATVGVDLILRLLERVPAARRFLRRGYTRGFRRYRDPTAEKF